ncbi:MAG: cofactor assembly of complex C subunit B [Leptolyngbya sp.]|nr:cofactor assembly of complex C subunit B [Leptolyngbya sp.]
MTDTVIYSTLFLTLLMMVGLFFFIRASTKDRTEVLVLDPPAATTTTLEALTVYFEQRAYRLVSDPDPNQIRLAGQVRPSAFLAVFLSSLAAVGGLCFALVLSSLFPGIGLAFGGLVLLAPGAGWFYWQRAGREEQVTLATKGEETSQPQVWVTAHRDELIALEQAWKTQLRSLIITAAAEVAPQG